MLVMWYLSNSDLLVNTFRFRRCSVMWRVLCLCCGCSEGPVVLALCHPGHLCSFVCSAVQHAQHGTATDAVWLWRGLCGLWVG